MPSKLDFGLFVDRRQPVSSMREETILFAPAVAVHGSRSASLC